MEEEEEDTVDTTYCNHCKKDIASSNFQMHEVHCKRYIALCQYCQEPVPKSQLEDHFEENHAETSCDLCGMVMAKDQMEEHKEEECPERMIGCEFCQLDVKAPEFEEHHAACGSRTDECERCRKRVMLRFMADHLEHECSKPRIVNPYKKRMTGKEPTLDKGAVRRDRPKGTIVPRAPPVQQPTPVSVGVVRDRSPFEEIVEPPRLNVSPTISPKDLHPITRVDDPVGVTPLDESREKEDFKGQLNPSSNPTLVFDQEWVGSVAHALGDDVELDRAIADSIYQEELRRATVEEQPAEEEESTETEKTSDEEMAHRLQEQYNRQRDISVTDAVIAKDLSERSGLYTGSEVHVDDLLNDRTRARHLYDTLEDVKEHSEDGLFAQQLYREERFNPEGDMSTMMLYDRAMMFEQEEDKRLRQVEIDHEVAARLQEEQEEEEHGRGQLHPYDEKEKEQYPASGHGFYDPHTPDTLPYVPVGGTPEPSVPAAEPERDQSSPDQSIPCDICGEMVDFDLFRFHLEKRHPQFGDVIDRYTDYPGPYEPPPLKTRTPPPLSSYHDLHLPQDHTHHSAYQQLSHGGGGGVAAPPQRQEEEERGRRVPCAYCGSAFPPGALETHMTACVENPEEGLKSAYQNQDDDEDIAKELESVIPCQFCKKQVKIIDIAEHQENCLQRYSSRLFSRGVSAKDESEEDLPCVTCGKLFPSSMIYKHQVACGLVSKYRPHMAPAVDDNPPMHRTHMGRKPFLPSASTNKGIVRSDDPASRPVSLPEKKSSSDDEELQPVAASLDRMKLHPADPNNVIATYSGSESRMKLHPTDPNSVVATYSESDSRFSAVRPNNDKSTGRPNGKSVAHLMGINELTPPTSINIGHEHVLRGPTKPLYSDNGFRSKNLPSTGYHSNSYKSSPRTSDSGYKKNFEQRRESGEQRRGSGDYKPRGVHHTRQEKGLEDAHSNVGRGRNTGGGRYQSSAGNHQNRKKLAATFNGSNSSGSSSYPSTRATNRGDESSRLNSKQYGDVRRERNVQEGRDRRDPSDKKYGVVIEDEEEGEMGHEKMKLKKGSGLNKSRQPPYHGNFRGGYSGSGSSRSAGHVNGGGLSVKGRGFSDRGRDGSYI